LKILFLFSACEINESSLMKIPSYQPTTDEWPLHGVDIERERLLKGIDTLIKMDVAEQFRAPGNSN
jgi:2,3-bisphosphoglycerate-independent phosphoglycerate mutase